MMKSISNFLNKLNLCGSSTVVSNPQIPQKYKIGSHIIQEERLISEGGYGYVWEGHDIVTKKKFAVKKMLIQSPEGLALAEKEIGVLRNLPENQHIVRFYDGIIMTFEDNQTKMAILLFELCKEGSLLSYILKRKDNPLDERLVLSIFSQIIKALIHLHSQDPPIAHRDLKLENVLINDNIFKICDFGSCSTSRTNFKEIQRKDFYQYEEIYEKNTTLMYRPPEMIELYLKYAVNEKVDIWMLGCILYILLFYRHPFEEASKLAIINCAYNIPKMHKYSKEILILLSLMLISNPEDRISAFELDDIMENHKKTGKLEIPNEFLSKIEVSKSNNPAYEQKAKKTSNITKKSIKNPNKQPLMDSSNEWGDYIKASSKPKSEYLEENLDFNTFSIENKPPINNQWGNPGSFLNTFKISMPKSPKMEDLEEQKDQERRNVPFFSIGSQNAKH